jgi:hypothetical protein
MINQFKFSGKLTAGGLVLRLAGAWYYPSDAPYPTLQAWLIMSSYATSMGSMWLSFVSMQKGI